MITIIKILFKNNMFQVFLDNEEYFTIPVELYSVYKLEKGKLLDKLEYQQLKEESERFQCYQRALTYLAIRNRSAKEIELYLRKKKYSEYMIQEAIIKLKDNNYISDYEYAVEYIKVSSIKKTVGQQYLRSKLYQRGVSRQVINKALKTTKADQVELEVVCDLARKKYQQVKSRPNPGKKIATFLAGRGFDWDIIRKVMEILKEECDLSQENDFCSE